jgi:hypothetical protein
MFSSKKVDEVTNNTNHLESAGNTAEMRVQSLEIVRDMAKEALDEAEDAEEKADAAVWSAKLILSKAKEAETAFCAYMGKQKHQAGVEVLTEGHEERISIGVPQLNGGQDSNDEDSKKRRTE